LLLLTDTNLLPAKSSAAGEVQCSCLSFVLSNLLQTGTFGLFGAFNGLWSSTDFIISKPHFWNLKKSLQPCCSRHWLNLLSKSFYHLLVPSL